MILKVRENIEMRTLVLENAEEIFSVIDKNRDILRQWLLWVDETKSVENIRKKIQEWEQNIKDKSRYNFGIFQNGDYIGHIGVHSINGLSESAMIGYWLSPYCQGNGIMTDCVRKLTDYCFDENGLNLNSVHISCADGNKKSRAVPERLNFIQEGVLQDCMKYYGVYYDEVIYGVLKRNWCK